MGKKRKKDKKKQQEEEKDNSEDDDEEIEEDVCDLPGVYASSKVKALCQRNFDKSVAKSGSPWLIKFFDEHPSRQTQTHEMVHIWKHLANTLPLQHCRIAVVDCKNDKNLCNKLKV